MLGGISDPPTLFALTVITTVNDTLAYQLSGVERIHPDNFTIVLGDFKQVHLSRALPKFRQQVKCTTRGLNTLDHCYCTIKQAYHLVIHAALGTDPSLQAEVENLKACGTEL